MVDDELLDFVPIRKKSAHGWNYLRLMIHGLAWGQFLVLLACVVPRVEPIFADFGLPLPNVTMLVIDASHLIVAVVALTGILLVADGFVMTRFSSRGEAESLFAWSCLMVAAPVVMGALTLWALVLPMLTVMQRLSG